MNSDQAGQRSSDRPEPDILNWPDGEYERIRVISEPDVYDAAFGVAVHGLDAAIRELETYADVLAAVEPALANAGVSVDSSRTLLE